jgi:hypothetical protein
MTNEEMGQSYVLTAKYSLEQAKAAYADGIWHLGPSLPGRRGDGLEGGVAAGWS